MFQFIKKIKLAFTEKQELLSQIEYLKKRNEFLDNIAKDMEKILSDEACKSLKKASVLLDEIINSHKIQKQQISNIVIDMEESVSDKACEILRQAPKSILAECVDLMKELDSLVNPKSSCPPPPPIPYPDEIVKSAPTIMSKAPNPQTQPRPTGGNGSKINTIMPYIPQPRPTGVVTTAFKKARTRYLNQINK